MPAPELVLDALSKTYVARHPVAALRACSLRVAGGECVAILGASGCGKTTLLRTIAGLETPDAGHVFIAERDVTALATRRRNVGFVFQHDALFARKTAYENVAFGLRARGTPEGEVEPQVRAIAARVRAADVLPRRVSTLSGGERQRVAIARALAPAPDILLLDEPLSRLDAGLRRALRRELTEVARSRVATMVYVTHEQEDALALGDRIAVMRDGAIAQIGTPRELFERPVDRFVAQMVGVPAIAFVPARFVFDDARANESAGLRATAVRIAADGSLRGIVRAVEDFVDVTYAYVEGDFGTLVARGTGDVVPVVGEHVSLAVDRTRALRFAPEGTRVAPGTRV